MIASDTRGNTSAIFKIKTFGNKTNHTKKNLKKYFEEKYIFRKKKRGGGGEKEEVYLKNLKN